MNTKTTYLFLILLVFSGFLKAQTDTLKKKPFIKLYAFGLNLGPLMNNQPLTANALMKMSPENKLLQQDYNSFKTNYSTKSEGFSCGLQTSFIFRDRAKNKHNNKQELRIAIHAQSAQSSDLTYEKEERVRFDTLISHTNPKVYYVDTVKTYTHFLNNEQSNYLIDLSYIIFLRPQNKIFSLYLGSGIGYGMIVQNYVKARLRYDESFYDQDGNNYTYYEESQSSGYTIREETQLPQSSIYQGALNGGVLIRFSKIKKNRVSRFAVNMDCKTGLRLLQLPNIGMYKQFFFNVNFGVKFYLNREVYN